MPTRIRAASEEPQVSASIETYRTEIAPALMESLGTKNPMRVPRLRSIVLNMGVGDAARDKNAAQTALDDLMRIAGQRPVITRAKKSIAGFGIRDGWPVGCKATLRRARMYDFLDRLIRVVIPRVRDFRGFSPGAFDGRGNYSLGIAEQIVFPEIDYDRIDKLRGLNITITTTARSDEDARLLLAAFNFPFKAK